MDLRGMYSSSQSYDTEYGQDWNYTHHDPRLHFENVPRISNDLTMGSYGSIRASNSRHSHGPYLHLSTTVNSGLPSTYIQHVPPCYNHFASGSLSSTVIPQIEHGRVSYKRKPTAFYETFDGSSSRGYYHAGSSSSVSSDPLHPDARSVHQLWPPTGPGLNCRSNNIFDTGEGSQRNVRSRYSGTFHMEPNTIEHQPMNNLPRPILPANVSGPIISGERIPSPASLDPYGRMGFSDVGSFSHETNRTFVGGGSSSSGMESYHNHSLESYHNHSLRRNPSTSLPAFEVPPRRGTELAQGIHRGQITPYRAIPSYHPFEDDRRPSYHPVGFTASGDRRPGVESMVPSRYSRPLSDGRIERGRSFYSGLQPISDEDIAPERWLPQGVAMVDRSDLFDSRSFFDYSSDMSLDVDDMSYEELLALEEMIGDVNTGLSEGTAAKCLTEITHSSDRNQGEEDDKCTICLEEYKNRDGLAKLNCGHDYHVGCIKKWLLIKKVCPLCKASVVEE